MATHSELMKEQIIEVCLVKHSTSFASPMFPPTNVAAMPSSVLFVLGPIDRDFATMLREMGLQCSLMDYRG